MVSEEEDNTGSVVNKNLKNELNGNWLSSASSSIHEARLKAKAKRRLRKNSSRDSGRGDSFSDNGDVIRGTSVAPASPKSKLLDRKSRLGKGRGLPKKGRKRPYFTIIQSCHHIGILNRGKQSVLWHDVRLFFFLTFIFLGGGYTTEPTHPWSSVV